ncbi:MAG: glycosyltransferase family 2 protein [Bacteroidota bacterium]|nr:glycosyltransferase family 2 protein [Bacteroidota bacterium]
MANPEVSFIIPVYNEVEVFSLLVERMDALASRMTESCEVILVDDGSTDGTSLLMETLALKDPKYQCIFLSRNFGQQKALGVGLDFARGEYIMLLDADLQDPPELYFEFFAKIKEGYDVVYGIRKGRKEGLLKRGSYNFFYRFLNHISNYPIPKHAGDFGMITRRVAKAINLNREESRFLRGIRSWVGFNQIGLEYERRGRAAGSAKYSLDKLIKLALDGIFNFTTIPIKVLILLGILCISA